MWREERTEYLISGMLLMLISVVITTVVVLPRIGIYVLSYYVFFIVSVAESVGHLPYR